MKKFCELRALDRWPYFGWGCALMAIKYNLDRLIAEFGFNHSWYFWNYIKPHGFAEIDAVPPNEQTFYIILLLTALPFLMAGLWLTLRRLRSAGLPLTWCLLFFVPVINLIFFVVLSVLPKKATQEHRGLVSFLPKSAFGSALASTVIVGVVGAGLAFFSTEALRNYGWGLFVALPFSMGLVSVLIYAGRQKRTLGSCLLVSMLPLLFCALCLLAMAAEGAICLLMAAPIGLVLALAGGLVGYIIIGNRSAPLRPSAMMMILLAVPITVGMEQRADIVPPLLFVTTSVVINAPPEQI